jgi:acetylornithine aminotransferase
MTLAKALGNGVPIGACLAKGAAAEQFHPGQHGSTYGGNPLACRAALAVLETMEKLALHKRAATLGEKLLQALQTRLADLPGVTEVRGRGLLLGIELEKPCGELTKLALAEGLLINVTADNVIRLLPPLVMSDSEADQLVDGLSKLVTRFLAA